MPKAKKRKSKREEKEQHEEEESKECSCESPSSTETTTRKKAKNNKRLLDDNESCVAEDRNSHRETEQISKRKKKKPKNDDVEDLQKQRDTELLQTQSGCELSTEQNTRKKKKKSHDEASTEIYPGHSEQVTESKDRLVQVKPSVKDPSDDVSELSQIQNGPSSKVSASDKEKKRERMRKKKESKKLEREAQKKRAERSDGTESGGTAQKEALSYLQLWHTDKVNWKFNKVRQVWLLKNLYNSDKVLDTTFEVLLEYLDGLQGKSRQVTKTQAEQLIDQMDTASPGEETDNQKMELQLDRAKQILQTLT